MDTIDLLGVPVRAMCSGRAEGPVVGILAVCHQRRSGRHAQIRLHLPEERFHGEPGGAEAWLAHRLGRVDRFVERLSQATAQSPDRVRSDLERGALLDADAALAYGLLDEVVGRPDAEVISFPATDRPPDDSR
jgi:ATP-dependent Clp protease protease subunit